MISLCPWPNTKTNKTSRFHYEAIRCRQLTRRLHPNRGAWEKHASWRSISVLLRQLFLGCASWTWCKLSGGTQDIATLVVVCDFQAMLLITNTETPARFCCHWKERSVTWHWNQGSFNGVQQGATASLANGKYSSTPAQVHYGTMATQFEKPNTLYKPDIT